MLFLSLLQLSSAKAPVIIIPPLYGTNLWTTYEHTNLPKKCPQSQNDSELWLDPYYFLPGKLDCLFSLLTVYEDENGNATNLPNVSLHVHDFGGEESNRYVAHLPKLGAQFVVSFAKAIDTFKKNGYTLKKDLYVIPYDWRLAPVFIDEVYQGIEDIVHRAYEENGQQKVTIFGFSMGGFVTQQFMSKHTQEWKDKYISQTVFLAPSFTGAIEMLYWVHLKRIQILPKYSTPAVNLMMQSWPCIFAHMPNPGVWDNFTVIIGPDGEEYKSNDVRNIIETNSFIDKQFMRMYGKAEQIISEFPKSTGVPTTIVFNSGVTTVERLKFKDWKKTPTTINGFGDGRIPSYGLQKVCDHWPDTRCIDLHNGHESFSHQPMISNQHILDMIYNLTTFEDPVLLKDESWYKA